MRRRGLGAVALAVATACASVHPVAVGQTLDLVLPKLDGGGLSVGSFHGKVVLVDVWASWCRPCTQSLPFYADLQNAYRAKGFVFVGVNVDEDERAARAFLKENSLDLLTLRDPGAGQVGPRFGISRMPTAFFVDRAGRVRRTHEGFSPSDEAPFRKLVEDLLAEGADTPVAAAPAN